MVNGAGSNADPEVSCPALAVTTETDPVAIWKPTSASRKPACTDTHTHRGQRRTSLLLDQSHSALLS